MKTSPAIAPCHGISQLQCGIAQAAMAHKCYSCARTSRNLVDEVLRHSQLPQSQLVVILVVQHIHEVRIEWVNVVHLWKATDNGQQLVMPRGRCVLHFPHIKRPYALDGVAFMHHGGRLPLGL